MLFYKVVVQYPKEMPADGSFGSNKKYFDQFISDCFLGLDRASGGYPYPEKNIQQAKWFDDLESANAYLASFKDQETHWRPKYLRVEVG